MFKMWKSIIVALSLGYFSVEDIRKKEIGGLPLVLTGIVGIVLAAVEGIPGDWHVLLRFAPGIVCLFLGWATGEGIGYGDGLTILCLGCFLDLEQLLGVCFTALVLAGVFALVLLFGFHRGRKTRMPFVPFLLAGYGIMLLT